MLLNFAVVLAQADSITGGLLQYGVLGIAALVLGGAVRSMYQRLTSEADKQRELADELRKELRDLNASVRTDCVKALADAARVMSDTLDVLRREGDDREGRP